MLLTLSFITRWIMSRIEKREEERAQKHEKAHRVKEAFARGGEQVLIQGKWPHLTQD
jgi:hypothetical protein